MVSLHPALSIITVTIVPCFGTRVVRGPLKKSIRYVRRIANLLPLIQIICDFQRAKLQIGMGCLVCAEYPCVLLGGGEKSE